MSDDRDRRANGGRRGGELPDGSFDARITRVLAAHADVLVLDDRPFLIDGREHGRGDGEIRATDENDGTTVELDLLERAELRPVPVSGSVSTIAGSRRPGRRGAVVWVAAAAAVVVLVVAVAAIRGNRDSSVATYTGGGAPLVSTPVFVPSWVPDGLLLQDLAVRPPPEREPSRVHRQLLESASSDAAVLLHIEIDRPYFVPLGTERAARGTTVGVRPSLETIGSVPLTELRWSEGDGDISATTRDLNESDAIALLDALTWADPADPLAGFQPPAGWTVRTEPTTGSGSGAETVLTYIDPASPGTAALRVQASAAGDVAPGYLLTSMVGRVGDDGVAVATQDAGLPGTSSMTNASWPDGRRVAVSGGDGLDDATAERIALAVRPASGEEVAALGAELSQRLATGEVLAAADLLAGRVELIGSPDPAAVCLVVDGARTCRGIVNDRGGSGLRFVAGSTAIGPMWFVFGASREGIQITDDDTTDAMFPVLRDGKPIDPNMPMKIGAPVASDGPWYLSVLAVRDDAAQAWVTGDGGTITVGRTLI